MEGLVQKYPLYKMKQGKGAGGEGAGKSFTGAWWSVCFSWQQTT